MIRVETDLSLTVTDWQPAQRVVVVVVVGGRPARPPQSTAAVNQRLSARLMAGARRRLRNGHTWTVITYDHTYDVHHLRPNSVHRPKAALKFLCPSVCVYQYQGKMIL